jgi:hypothetical protein
MAPYSPAIGLSLAHESQAPPPPKLSTKLLSSLVTHPHLHPSTSQSPSNTDESLQLKPRKLMYSPHIPNAHGRRSLDAQDSTTKWPGLSTVIFSVLLVMLIGASTSSFQYEKQGREQSVVDMVRETYFDQGISVPLNERDVVQPRSVYLVEELEIDMTLDMEKRDGEPTSSIAAPLASPSVMVTSSSATPTSSSMRSAPSAAKSEFKDPDNVRDPTAVKPSGDQSMASVDSDPTETPSKRHWSSRYRRESLGRRAYQS